MKKIEWKPIAVLCSICLAVALMLSLVNTVTAPIIREKMEAAATKALTEVLPGGKNFTPLTIDGSYPSAITAGYKADGGFVFTASVTGKYPDLIVSIGIDTEGKIVATKVISSGETPEYSDKVFPLVEGTNGKYAGVSDPDNFEPFLVTKATYTSEAYAQAVKAALQAYIVANGGEVDLRSPEKILQDNCNAALGTTDLTYTKWFATEILEGVTAVYEAPAKEGFVFVIGDRFVGVNADGEIVTPETDAETAATVTAAYDVYKASKTTDIAEIPTISSKYVTITKISKTETGNYVFELSAKGFSSHHYDEYGKGSNTPMSILVSISADAKIIDCRTITHDESRGYGDKCATEDYYDAWKGATESDVATTGIITGATYTTDGYQRAIKIAFQAFNILTGGANA